jgi:hypothetical protein
MRSEVSLEFLDSKLFPATEFLVQVLQHLPDPGTRLIRRYGLYSSCSRGTPRPTGALARREGGRAADSESPLRCPCCGSQMRVLV